MKIKGTNVTFGIKEPYFMKEYSYSKSKCTEDGIITMLKFQVEKFSLSSGDRLSNRQWALQIILLS